MPPFNALVGVNPYIQDCEIRLQETRNISLLYGVKHFDILNRLGITHEYA